MIRNQNKILQQHGCIFIQAQNNSQHKKKSRHSCFKLLTVAIFLLTLISAPILLFGQQKVIVKNNEQWMQYYNQTKISEKWSLFFDGGYRWKNEFQESSQYIIRFVVGYNLNSEIQITSGLAHLGFYSFNKINKVEFRTYQEISFKNTLTKINLIHRFRVEERFFNPVINCKVQPTNTFNFRFRYALLLNIPLFKLSKLRTEIIFLLTIVDEIFVNAGQHMVNSIFDQNRFIISPTLKFGESMTLSLTWNSQFASTASQTVFNYNNIYWLQIKHMIDRRK